MDYNHSGGDGLLAKDEEASLAEANAKLKQQLRAKQQELDDYVEGQNQQMETYRSQIDNFKAQIELFEQKLEQADKDRAQNERRMQQMRQDNAAAVKQMEFEKDDQIVSLQRDVANLEGQLHCCGQQIAEEQEALALADAAKAELTFEIKRMQNLIAEKDNEFIQFKARMSHEYESAISEVKAQSTTLGGQLEELLEQQSSEFKAKLQEHQHQI